MINETPKQAAERFAAPMLDKGFEFVTVHIYTDTEGNPLYFKSRAKHPDKTKWVRPFKLNGNGYEMGEPKFPNGKPLYAQHIIAKKPDAEVWVFEGEQKVQAATKRGLVATTSGSATSAATTNWEILRNRKIRIWPDNDEPGISFAGDVATILLGLDCTVSCVDVDKLGLGVGDDIMEWLEAHPDATKADIEALPVLTPSNTNTDDQWPDPLPIPDSLPAVKPFDYSMLPDSLRPWIEDITERVQCPPDFAAVGAMISLSAVVGSKIGIRPKRRDDWLEVPNLWGGIVGRPGVMKSPALRESCAHFAR